MRMQEVRKLFLSFTFVASVMYITDGFSIMGIYFSDIFRFEGSFLKEYSGQLYLPLLLFLFLFLGIVLGRFFCGWICPITAIMNITTVFARKKPKINLKTKYVFLFFTVVVLYFEYTGKLSLTNELLKPGFLLGITAIVVASLFYSRIFCTNICPLGAFFSLLGYVSIFRLDVGEDCKKCNRCNSVCEMGIDVMNSKPMNECSFCWNCVEECPYKSIRLRFILS